MPQRQEFEFRLFPPRLIAKGTQACDHAAKVAKMSTVLIGVPIAIGFGWAIATGVLSPTALVRTIGFFFGFR